MKAPRNDERIDRVQKALLMAVKVSEEEIDAVAGQSDLYDGLLVKIATGKAQAAGPQMDVERRRASGRRRLDLSPPLWVRPPLRWTLTAAAILLIAALAILLLLPGQSRQSTQIAPALPQQFPPPPPGESRPAERPARADSLTAQIGKQDPAQIRSAKSLHRHHRHDSRSAEVATDFFPLTFTADSAAHESGHVVRVKIARTVLIAFGLPMNVARAGELITADVVIGDDGLARAIRFIQ